MSHNSNISLEGNSSLTLPKFVAHYSEDRKWYFNSIQEAMKDAVEKGLEILRVEKTKLNENLFAEAEAFVYSTQHLLDSFLLNIYGKEDLDYNYEEEFLIFISALNNIKSKVIEMENKFISNFELLERAIRINPELQC